MGTIESIYTTLLNRLGANHEVGYIIPEIEKYSDEYKMDIADIQYELRKFIRAKEEKTELDHLILESINIMKMNNLINKVHGNIKKSKRNL